LDTYVDDLDPAYTGNWDIIADPEMVDYGGTMTPRINDVTPSNPSGFPANDTNSVFETFDFSSCVSGATSVQAAMDATFLIGVNQTSTFAGKNVIWNVNYNGTYRENDCSANTTGGTWSRDDGKIGTFTLD